jgi:antitoxin component YwqK of YwqJK toxin-antitoxin module
LVGTSDVPAFQAAASYSFGMAAAAMGLTSFETELGGGLYNFAKSINDPSINASGWLFNNPTNVPNIEQGIAAAHSDLFPTSSGEYSVEVFNDSGQETALDTYSTSGKLIVEYDLSPADVLTGQKLFTYDNSGNLVQQTVNDFSNPNYEFTTTTELGGASNSFVSVYAGTGLVYDATLLGVNTVYDLSGNSNTLTTGTGPATLVGSGNDTLTSSTSGSTLIAQGNGNTVNSAIGDAVQVAGSNNNVNLASNNTATVSGSDNVINMGQNSTAEVDGNGDNIKLSGNDTVNTSNATVQDFVGNGTDTVVGSGNNISTDAGLTVDGNNNTIGTGLDGTQTTIVGNNNTYHGQDSESISVTGSNNDIIADELPTINVVAGTDNTINSLGSNVDLGAGASIVVPGEGATVTSTSYGTDQNGNLITTSDIYNQQGSDITPISTITTVTDADGNIISESSDSTVDDGGDYYTINSTITSNEDGSQVLSNTYSDDQGNPTATLEIDTDAFGDETSASLTTYQADGQIGSVTTGLYSDGGEIGWSRDDYDDSGHLTASTTATFDDGGQEIENTTRYDDNGAATEVDTYDNENLVRADVYDNGVVTETDTYAGAANLLESDFYDNGVVTEKDTYSDGTLAQVASYDSNGLPTELDTYTDGTISQALLYDSGGQPATLDTYNTDGTLSQEATYENGVPVVTWTPSDGPLPGDGPTDPDNGTPPAADPVDDVPDPSDPGFDPTFFDDGELGFAGSQSVIANELNSSTGSIAAQRLSSGDYEGAVAAESGLLQARESASATPTSNTGNSVGNGSEWAGNVITWSMSGDAGSQYEAEAQQAFATWAAASGLKFDEVSGSAPADIRISFGNLDSATTGIVGYTTLQGGGGITAAASIELENPDQDALVSGTGGQLTYSGTDATLEQVMLHEIGHALGLGDDTDQDSIMYYELTSSNSKLDSTDIAGIQALYGADRLNSLIAGMSSFTPQTAASTSLTHDENVRQHETLAASAT